MKNFIGTILIVVCCLTHGTIAAQTLKLASKGVPNYSIVTAKDASIAEKFAAQELGDNLAKICNTKFKRSDMLSAKSIVVSTSSTLAKLTKEKITDLSGEQSGIFLRGNTIYLVGGSDRAVIYAVYGFLEKLGCAWYAPEFNFFQGSSSFIPSVTNLSYSHKADITDCPQLKYRKFYVEEGLSHTTENLMQLIDWMPKLKYNTLVIPINYEGRGVVKWDNWREKLTPELKKRGIMIEVGGHGYQNYMNAAMDQGNLYKNHPEWFGMDKSGNRSTENRIVFCTSNKDAIDYLHNSISVYLKSHPEIDIFDFWPPDGDRWCECEKCKVTSPTDRHLALVSATARFMKKEHPNVILECLAYSKYVAPPKIETLDKEVLLDFCPIGQNFETQIYEDIDANNIMYKKSLLEWPKSFKGDISIYSYFRKYVWQSIPNIIPHYMQKDVQFYKSVGAVGISVYCEPGDWFAYGPNHYVLGHLAQNPDVDVDKLMKAYTENVFGKAADVALSVYSELEDYVSKATRFPSSQQKTDEQYEQYTVRNNKCLNMVNDAMKRPNLDKTTINHLNRLSLMLQYVGMSIDEARSFAKIKKRPSMNVINDQVRKFFEQNNDQGIFIIRHK